MSIRTTLAAVALAACAATPASAVTVTYEKEHTVTPTSGGARVDFGAAVSVNTAYGTFGACARDKAAWSDGVFGPGGIEGGETGIGC